MNKYLKYLIYLIPIILIIYFGRKVYQKDIINKSIDKLVPIAPPHSHDYAYKRAYLNPIHKNNYACRAHPTKTSCIGSCKDYHYNFPRCVYSQPKCIELSCEDNKESETSKVIKKMDYF